MERPFRILGLQQIAVGGLDKARLRKLWIDTLGLTLAGNYRSERENVDEDIAVAGKGAFIVGPQVFGLISSATGSQRLAIGANAAFFVVALVAMAWVDEGRGRAAAEAWSVRSLPEAPGGAA